MVFQTETCFVLEYANAISKHFYAVLDHIYADLKHVYSVLEKEVLLKSHHIS